VRKVSDLTTCRECINLDSTFRVAGNALILTAHFEFWPVKEKATFEHATEGRRKPQMDARNLRPRTRGETAENACRKKRRRSMSIDSNLLLKLGENNRVNFHLTCRWQQGREETQ
jgi:hypothetical protein